MSTLAPDCNFTEEPKKRGPVPKGYVEDLEMRCELLERLIYRLAPELNLRKEIGPKFTRETWSTVEGGLRGLDLPMQLPEHSFLQVKYEPSPLTESCELPEQETEGHRANGVSTEDIEDGMKTMSINGFGQRFVGKSSGAILPQVVMGLKDKMMGQTDQTGRAPIETRPQFWVTKPWKWMAGPKRELLTLQLPPEDLADDLINLCFANGLIFFPLLHRPTFEKLRQSGAVEKDPTFARLYLLVCALGARFSNDERVCLPSADPDVKWYSAGWAWFSQVQCEKPLIAPVELSDLQILALSALYLHGTSEAHASWLFAGVGLRLAQDVGAHREKAYRANNSFENQMWRRVFWCLIAIDRMMSAVLGRPICIFDEEYAISKNYENFGMLTSFISDFSIDVDLPLEVDDEHYDDLSKEWKQPENKPSTIVAFNHYVKLLGVFAYAIRTVYSINKSKVNLGFVGPEWESRTISGLDSALNSWHEKVPQHLKWDPTTQNQVFLRQSAFLYATYHYVQITVHRPFLPVIMASANKTSPLSLPSLAICSNAARAASHMLELGTPSDTEAMPFTPLLAATTAIILIMNILGDGKDGVRVDLAGYQAGARRCIGVLQRAEKRWHIAGRIVDMLNGLLEDGPTSCQIPSLGETTRKRPRTESSPSKSPTSVETETTPSSQSPTDYPPMAVNPTLEPFWDLSYVDGLGFSGPQVASPNAIFQDLWNSFTTIPATMDPGFPMATDSLGPEANPM